MGKIIQFPLQKRNVKASAKMELADFEENIFKISSDEELEHVYEEFYKNYDKVFNDPHEWDDFFKNRKIIAK